jgi:3-methyladenine DNA glycosylase AlkD
MSQAVDFIISRLESMSDPEAVSGMARVGITGKSVYGIKLPELRRMAREIGHNHELALKLWEVNNRETRILASLIDIPSEVMDKQMEDWVLDFDSWEICDQCCMNLFEKMPQAWGKAAEWSFREEKFVKRAGFVLMARLAVSDKKAPDKNFLEFFPHIRRGAEDSRNIVKKGVNWALRQIGKRSLQLNAAAVRLCEELLQSELKSVRWVANDALRELQSHPVLERLKRKSR